MMRFHRRWFTANKTRIWSKKQVKKIFVMQNITPEGISRVGVRWIRMTYSDSAWSVTRVPVETSTGDLWPYARRFWQNSMEKQHNRTEKNKLLRTGFEPVSRYIHALKPLSYMRTVLVLFCLARYSYFIIQSSNEWIFKLNTISCHHKIGSPNLYKSILLNHIFLLCQWPTSLRKNRHQNR